MSPRPQHRPCQKPMPSRYWKLSRSMSSMTLRVAAHPAPLRLSFRPQLFSTSSQLLEPYGPFLGCQYQC